MTTEQTRPDRDTAAGDLEDALTDIRNACTLINSGDNDDIVLARYLGRQIEDHHLAAAWNAYCRIFALDDHREGARPLVRPSPSAPRPR
jgi:hypothetical protein